MTKLFDNSLVRLLLVNLAAAICCAAGPAAAPPIFSATPLDELGTGTYLGQEGGLYPGGSETRPAAHGAVGVAIANAIVPLDANGNYSATGKIGFCTVGVSNGRLISEQFLPLANAEPTKDTHVKLVNGCQFGATLNLVQSPTYNYWTSGLPSKISAAGLSKKQIQAVWIVEGVLSTTQSFPTHAVTEQGWWVATLHNLKTLLPNVKLAFCTTPGYGGFFTPPPTKEPLFYESAFGLKWAIEQQIAGDPALDLTVSPWLAWAAYHWPDGETTRQDGLFFDFPEDYLDDGMHPSPSGSLKVAQKLLDFMLTDPAAAPWFVQ